jgi:hypothetical protein
MKRKKARTLQTLRIDRPHPGKLTVSLSATEFTAVQGDVTPRELIPGDEFNLNWKVRFRDVRIPDRWFELTELPAYLAGLGIEAFVEFGP